MAYVDEACELCTAVLALQPKAHVQEPRSLMDVVAVCSMPTVLLDVCETILQRKVEGADRSPFASAQTNIDLAVKGLAQDLKLDLDHVSGRRICEGSMSDTLNLLELLNALGQQRKQQQGQAGTARPRPETVKQAARTPAAVSSTPAPPQPQPHSQPAQYILSPAKQQPHPPHPASPQQQLLGLQYWCVAEEGGPLPSNLSHDDMQLLAQAGAVVLMPTSVTQQAELTAGTAAVTEGGAGGSSSSCVVHNDIIPDPDLTYEEAIGLLPYGQKPLPLPSTSGQHKKPPKKGKKGGKGKKQALPPTQNAACSCDLPSSSLSLGLPDYTPSSSSSSAALDPQEVCSADTTSASQDASYSTASLSFPTLPEQPRQLEPEQQMLSCDYSDSEEQQQYQQEEQPGPEQQEMDARWDAAEQVASYLVDSPVLIMPQNQYFQQQQPSPTKHAQDSPQQQQQQEWQQHEQAYAQQHYHQQQELEQLQRELRDLQQQQQHFLQQAQPYLQQQQPISIPTTLSPSRLPSGLALRNPLPYGLNPAPYPIHFSPPRIPIPSAPALRSQPLPYSYGTLQPGPYVGYAPPQSTADAGLMQGKPGSLSYIGTQLQRVLAEGGGEAASDAQQQSDVGEEDNEGDANAEPEEEGQATGKDASQPKAKKRTTRSGKVLVSRPKGKGQKQGLKQKRKGAVKEKECGLEGAEAGAEGEGREEEEVCDEGQLLADISQLQALSWAVEQHHQQQEAWAGDANAGGVEHGAVGAGRWAALAQASSEARAESAAEEAVERQELGSEGGDDVEEQWEIVNREECESQQEEGAEAGAEAAQDDAAHAHDIVSYPASQASFPASQQQQQEGEEEQSASSEQAASESQEKEPDYSTYPAFDAQQLHAVALERATAEARRLAAAAAAMLRGKSKAKKGGGKGSASKGSAATGVSGSATRAHAHTPCVHPQGTLIRRPQPQRQPAKQSAHSQKKQQPLAPRVPPSSHANLQRQDASVVPEIRKLLDQASSKATAQQAAIVYDGMLVRPHLFGAPDADLYLGSGKAQADAPAVPANNRLAMNKALAAKLAYVNTLAHGSSKGAAAQVRVAAAALQDQDRRTSMQARSLVKQAQAGLRRDQAMKAGVSSLEARGQVHTERVEQLRLQRLEAELKAAEKARRARALHRQEMAIRDAFMQALEDEKMQLLAVRAEGRRLPSVNNLQRLKAAEEKYLGLISLLEDIAVKERRQRVVSEIDAKDARRTAHSMREAQKRQALFDLYARCERDETAALARHKENFGLVDQMRRTIGL